MAAEQFGWYSVRDDRRWRYSDDRLVEVGKTLTVDVTERPLELFFWGIHAHRSAMAALRSDHNPVIARVRFSGDVIFSEDHAVASELTPLWILDTTKVIHELAHLCLERSAARWAGHKVEAEREWEMRVFRWWHDVANVPGEKEWRDTTLEAMLNAAHEAEG